MANSSKLSTYFVLVALLASSIFINPASCDLKTQALIDQICLKMEDYTFCNNTFHQHVIGPVTDSAGLAQIALQLAINSALGTHNIIGGLLQKTTDPAEKNALTVCENAYRLVMDSLQQAKSAFFEANYDDMLKFEELAPRAQASCTTIFDTPPNPPNPITEKNTQSRILIAMAILAGTKLTSGGLS